jgi:hypothetical protein
MSPENHKGKACLFSIKVVTCQEGICKECQVYKDWIGVNKISKS